MPSPAPSSGGINPVDSGATKPPRAVSSLPRLLGPLEAITMVVGSMIGSGIFLKEAEVARHLGSFGAIALVWIIVGLLTLCGALAVAELAAMLPHAGGPYVYLRRAYGTRVAYLWGWSEFAIVRTGTLGSLASATVVYLRPVLAACAKAVPESWTTLHYLLSLPYWLQGTLTLLIIALLTWINVRGTRYSAWTQNITTFVKVGFLALLFAGPLLFGSWEMSNLQPLAPTSLGWGFWKAVGLSMLLIYWPYDGWINIAPLAEEIREPQRNVPRGLMLGLFLVIVVYVGTITGYHLVLPMADVASTQTVAADVFGKLLGDWGIPLAATGVMFSTFGALNSNLMTGPRIYFALARDGLFPRFLQDIHNRNHTPAKAIWTQGIWAMLQVILACMVSRSAGEIFDYLTDLVVLAGTLFYMLSVGAVIVLRLKEANLDRPYRCWGYPFTPWIYLIGSSAVLCSGTWGQILAVAGLLLLGILVAPLIRSLES